MMSLKKFLPEIFIFPLLGIFYFVSRLTTIMAIPIFTDEAIYVRWAQIAKQDASWRFISLTDGKQPSFVWIAMIIMKYVNDPLLAGRLVSVGAGFITMIGLFFLGKELFKRKWVGIIAASLYLIFPMALVYDRMALYDSLVAMFAVWGLYFEILLVRKLRLDLSLILGMIVGGAVLTKSNGFFNIYLMPVSILLLSFRKGKQLGIITKWVLLFSVSAGIGYIIYNILRLSPYFYIIAEKNTIFVYPFREWILHPLTYLMPNFSALINWFLLYMTIPTIILVLVSFVFEKKYIREKILLVLWFVLPFLALALFGKTLYPRFIFFMVTPLLVLAAYSIERIFTVLKNKAIAILLITAFLGFMLWADYFILFNFSKAPIPRSDLGQFINDWPSGGGVREAVEFFNKESQKGKIFIGTDGTFGLLPFALEIYLVDNPNVKIKGFYPINEEMPAELIAESKKIPTYFIFYQYCQHCQFPGVAPLTWNVTQIYRYNKINPNRYFTIYKVSPK